MEDNIKIDFQEVGWGMDWIDLAQDREQVAGSLKRGNEPLGYIRYGKGFD
jgi:hypothetical protein